jgi:integrase
MHRDWYASGEGIGEIRPEHYIFPFSSAVKPLDPARAATTIKSAWGSVREAAGVQCRFHDLRHTTLTKLAEAGVPESTMLALAGHMSRAMLERYLHIRMKAKRAAVDTLIVGNAAGSAGHVKGTAKSRESAERLE